MKNKERLICPDNIKCMLVFMVVLWHLPYNIPGINMLFAPFFSKRKTNQRSDNIRFLFHNRC